MTGLVSVRLYPRGFTGGAKGLALDLGFVRQASWEGGQTCCVAPLRRVAVGTKLCGNQVVPPFGYQRGHSLGSEQGTEALK